MRQSSKTFATALKPLAYMLGAFSFNQKTKAMKKVIKLQGIGMYEEEWKELHEKGKRVIFKYKRVFQLNWSVNVGGFYLQELEYLRMPTQEVPYTLRGKFVAYSAESANRLIGREVFNEF